jgi:excisionase family DNA binding protein
VDPENRYLSTAQVAKAIGVSVTTVKRWVDEGVLPAHKTVGGHRKLLLSEVLRVVRDGKLPQANLENLVAKPSGVDLRDLQTIQPQLEEALFSADQSLALALLQGAYQRGYSFAEIADFVLAPSLVEIGRAWETGRIEILHEHRATQILLTALYDLKASLRPPNDPNRPVAVGGAPEKDPTLIPTLLAKMTLLDNGWNAINLGPNTPLSAFRTALQELKPRLLWMCVTHLTDEEEFLQDYNKLFEEATQHQVSLVIGGRGLREPLRRRMRYTSFGDGMVHLASFARSIYLPPEPPKRGRPSKHANEQGGPVGSAES